jgi:tetratricopeptide (TPR) repeat protein
MKNRIYRPGVLMADSLDDDRCKVCGRPNAALRGLGIIITLRTKDFRQLELFLLGFFDEVPCDVCKSGLGVSPTALFVGHDPEILFYAAGTRMQNARAALDQNIRQVADQLSPSTLIEGYPDHSALRGAIMKQLRSALGPLKKLLEAKMGGSGHEWLREHVDEVGSSFFALAHVACTVPQIGVRGQRPDGGTVSRDELLESFGEDQSASWLALLQVWAEDSDKRDLEKDLNRHIGAESLLPGAADRTIEVMGKVLTSQEFSPLVGYVGHAIVASVAAAAGNENSYATDWTGRFFEIEMASALVNDASERAKVHGLLISEERARRTIPFQAAWDAVVAYTADAAVGGGGVRTLRKFDPHVMEALARICEKAGHADLLQQMSKTLHVTGLEKVELSVILEIVDKLASKANDNWEFNNLMTPMIRSLVEAGNDDGVIQVAERMIKARGGSDEVRADTETWLGTQLKLMRKPLKFLERIGDEAGEWEFKLPANVRVKLWTERSNSLRILGRQTEALAIIDQVIRDLPDNIGERNRRVALRNRAILLRETGTLDAAIQQLEDMTKEVSGEELIEILDSLSVTQVQVGMEQAALGNLDRALQLAKGPLAKLAPKLRASRALLLVLMNRGKETVADLVTLGASPEPMVLVAAASAWINLVNSDYELSPKEQATFVEVSDAINEMAYRSRQFGDFQLYLGCLRLYAGMLEALGEDELVGKVYEDIYAQCSELDQPRTYYELTALALRAYESGDENKGRSYLLELPAAIAGEVGATTDLWLASQGQVPKLRNRMAQLAAVVVQHADSFDDVRLISELQRDVIGRAQSLRRPGNGARQAFGMGAKELATLANENRQVAVLEWIAPAGLFGCFVSVISPNREVRSSYLERPPIDLSDLAKKIRSRLSNWYIGRRGDPFDLPEWRACEDWLAQQLVPHLATDGHLVVIEHEAHLGIPWHVAARRWTNSYASSWSTLLNLRSPVTRAPLTVGQILVPKSFEGEEVERALRQSASRTRAYAEARGILLVEEPESRLTDRRRFEEIMQSASVAKLLCHGFIDAEEHQIALLLAHEGELPLLSAASKSSVGRAHRFTWDDFRALRSAPLAVFSAACSTGASHLVGMGERLGLFAGLRRGGTRAFVAPKWDATAETVLPILDEALERYLSGETVVRAVHEACRRAESYCPIWQAWNLMVEGDWDEHL